MLKYKLRKDNEKMKLNKKGYTLVEVLAVLVILGAIMAIAIPNIASIINKNKTDNLEYIKKSIITAAKGYITDNRYEISVDGICSEEEEHSINKIEETTLVDSKIPVSTLIEKRYLKNKIIKKPNNTTETLNTTDTKITIKYNCKTKDYTYTLDSGLIWD